MRIERILTNNALVVLDEKGRERIVCGKGIGFKKRTGDDLDPALVEKTYAPAPDGKAAAQLEKLLTELPLEYVELSDRIVQMARLTLNQKLSDSLVISLADHLYYTLQRVKEGMSIANGLTWEIKQFYEKEFEVGLLAADMAGEAFGLRLPEAEAAFIAMHIVNAEAEDSTIDETFRITRIIQDVLNIVSRTFAMEFDTSSSYYYRFITHLKFFARRVLRGEQYAEVSSEELADIVFAKYAEPYRCAKKVSEFLSRQYSYRLNVEELMYLTIHIRLVVSKANRTADSSAAPLPPEEDDI